MMIHVVGDSHCMYPWNSIPDTAIHYVRDLLCYSFGREGRGRIDLRNFDLKDGDSVVFCLGEIDCRCHVHRQAEKQGVAAQSIIDGLVSAYMDAIEDGVASMADVSLNRVCVYNVVPPVEKVTVEENPAFPYAGTDDERLQYVLYFNTCLSAECAARGFLFVDVFDAYADERGFLRKDLSDGKVHLATPLHIVEFLEGAALA
jgi:hypothetical protein